MKYVSILIFTLASVYGFAQNRNLADYVNTLQGTNSKFELTRGNTYPTTAHPWGMNFWTPQTGLVGDGWIYQHFKDSIRGFRQTHQCSSWTNDYAAFSVMPVVGQLKVDQYGRAAKFSHDNEIAKPYYYSVKLDNGVRTEMSPTERGVYFRFSFPENKSCYIVLDGHGGGNRITISPDKRKITGFTANGSFAPKGFKNYFVIYFSKPFKSFGTWNNEDAQIEDNDKDIICRHGGGYVEFNEGDVVDVKIISSFISSEQAELNYTHELSAYHSIEDIKKIALDAWNKMLGKIEVSGGTQEERRTFYSCFFRSMLFPRKFYEYNADMEPVYYSPYDGLLHDGYMYTDNGLWDTFRAQFPLNTILHPEMHQRYIQSLLDAYDQSNWLPSWSFPGHNCGMVGNHSASLLADALVKGFSFDEEKALKAMLHEATNKGPYGTSSGRDCWQDYFTIGYVPYPETHESVAKTLEFCYDDFCSMQVARLAGNSYYEELFKKQVFNYKNIFDKSTRFFRGKSRAGKWMPEVFDPKEWGGPYTEGSAWHYRWSVFHDVQGLIDLLGGEKAFVAALDSVFSEDSSYKVGTYGYVIHEMREMSMINMGQYAHGNQPIQHMIYLYNYGCAPWKAQYWTRQVMNKLYSSGPNGYPGDEDQGQTSSWFVLSALGLYSVCPGTTQYVIGSPLFEKIKINLENGNQLIINAKNNSLENCYIQSSKINNKKFTRNWIDYKEIMSGGIIDYVMDDKPNYNRGIKEEDKPYSYSKE